MNATIELTPHTGAGPRTDALIGRGEGCHIRITGDPSVSRVHALVSWTGPGAYRVTDLGSSNGTRLLRGLNAYRLEPGHAIDVVRGDWVIVGDTWLSVGRH